jgi:hypothetical protein
LYADYAAAGGGTTDLGLVEVHDPSPRLPVLKQVAQVSGVGVGSTMIDAQFRELVCFIISDIHKFLVSLCIFAAWAGIFNLFKQCLKSFGSQHYEMYASFLIFSSSNFTPPETQSMVVLFQYSSAKFIS